MASDNNAFQDKVVFITGASSGIGSALACEFARQGATLILTGRRGNRLEKLARELTSQNRRAVAIECDVNSERGLFEAADHTRKLFGRIDVVVANAGFGVVGKAERLQLADYRRQFETNVFGVIRTFHATVSDLKLSRGVFVVMGSVQGYLPTPLSSPYSMSKFAIHAFAKTLSFELARDGVAVTHVASGYVKSEIRQVDNQGVLHEAASQEGMAWLQVPAPEAARAIVTAVRRRSREVIVTRHGKVLVFLQRHVPALVRYFIIKLGVKKRSEPGATS